MKNIIFIASLFASITLNAQTFTLKSNEMGGQATERQVFKRFGCNGKNISPHLFWENTPTGTKSFVVTIFDESAPTDSGWWHWVIFDIPSSVKELRSGAGNLSLNLAPTGTVQSITDLKRKVMVALVPPKEVGFTNI